MPWKDFAGGPLGEPKPPLRTSVGSIGRKILLKTNFFPVTIKNPNKDLVHYDVAIKQGEKGEVALPKKKRMHIIQTLKESYPKVFKNFQFAFDMEKNAYSIDTIPQLAKAGGEIYPVDVLEESGRTTQFQVKITKVNQANLKELVQAIKVVKGGQREMPSTIFQMLEVLFRHTPSTRFEKVGRCNFFPQHGEFGASYDIGGGKEGVVGFFGSLRPAVWKDGSVLLNIDVVHTAFYKEQMILDFLKESMNFRDNDFNHPMDNNKRKRLQRELKNLKILATHGSVPRTYKITDVCEAGADRQTFPITDEALGGKTTHCTVLNYFKQRYNLNLKYPKLNCLKVGPIARNIYIPMEFCKLTHGQKVIKRLSDRETATFIRQTAVPPKTRLQQIQNIVKANSFNTDPVMKALEFTIADTPMQIAGRVLPPPKLLMNSELDPRQGVWESRDRTFYKGAQIKEWAVINYDSYIQRDKLSIFLDNLQKIGRERGMDIQAPVQIQNSRQQQPEREFVQLKQKHPNLQMIMVILGKGGDLYGRVKRAGDRVVCIVTQCILGSNVSKNAPATLGNIVLKINAKMGGTNNVLGNASMPLVFQRPVMIMGADVNHPRAGDSSTPSLAAVVGSHDRFAAKYAVEIRHQKHRVEMIQDLKEMTRNLLMTFYEKTTRKPERIIMYRDGVSESQFLEVLSFELKAMRAACTSLAAGYNPGITFIVVQKRHHTRLFCQEQDGVGKSRNIPPGTLVDTFVTHPSETDFYLCSHQGIQGTSKPTHYHLLWDDNDITMDNLQTMTYALCHLYSRCTRSVSIPTPAYYAHLAAFRAKVHIENICDTDSDNGKAPAAEGDDGPGPCDAELTNAVRFDRTQEAFKSMYTQMYYV